MQLEDLTIIIPTKNEEKNIQSFANSLPGSVSLIVVDSSTDRTRELINICRPRKTTVIHEECNIPAARQLGAEAAATEWLLYSDADMIFAPSYFENLQRLHLKPTIGAVMGGKHSKEKYRSYYALYSFSIMIFSWFKIPIGSGSNMIIRKEALSGIKGFDLSLSHSEDSDILWRIRKAGWKVVFERTLKVYEIDHRRLDKGVIKKFWHGTLRAFFLITGIHKEHVRKSDWGYWKNDSQ